MSQKEATLVLRAQAGDREALDQLLQSVQQPLFRYLRRLVGSQALAEDLLQEVFLIVYRKLTWLRDPEVFRSWCYRIASREAFRVLKKKSRREEVLSELPANTNDEAPSRIDLLLESLPDALEFVSPASRAVIVLHYLHGLTLSEVADILSLSQGTVKSRLAYGLASLRRSLNEG